MTRHHIYYTLLLCLLPLWCEAQEVLYSWQSPAGVVEETGGTLEHINQNGFDKRNVRCGDWYTFVLNGDWQYMSAGYNVDECSHMLITLSDGHTFCEGDEIEVTAMRNNEQDRAASIYFLFHAATEVPLIDTHVWNNLGKGKDSTIGGSTKAKANVNAASCVNAAPSADSEASDAFTPSATFTPSTYTFIVPKEADGARSVRLTRWQTGDLLYVSRFVVTRPAATGLDRHPLAATNRKGCTHSRKFVRNGRVMVEHSGVEYSVSGEKLTKSQLQNNL